MQAIHNEIPDIIERVKDRLVARFEGRTVAVQVAKGMVGVTQEKEIGSDWQLGKWKQNHGLARRWEP